MEALMIGVSGMRGHHWRNPNSPGGFPHGGRLRGLAQGECKTRQTENIFASFSAAIRDRAAHGCATPRSRRSPPVGSK